MTTLLRIAQKLVLITLLFCTSCSNKENDSEQQKSQGPNDSVDMLYVMSSDINLFVDFFSQRRFIRDKMVWNGGLRHLRFESSKSSTLRSLIRMNFGQMSKADLERSFDSINYYLDKARRDFLYSNIPIDKNIIALAKDLLEGKLKVALGSDNSADTNINTISELLRIISVLPPENLVPSNIQKSYPKLTPAEVLNLMVKGIYSQIRKSYQAIYLESVREKYLPAICARYRIIAPIMKLDPALAGEVNILKAMVPRIHELLDNPEMIYGKLGVHLACIEVLEEVIGKSPDPRTGEGITERYLEFIAKYLWDYPMYGKSCAPFGGVMSSIPKSKDLPGQICKNNQKTVRDNLWIAYILNKYLSGHRMSFGKIQFAKKSVHQRHILQMENKIKAESKRLVGNKP